MAEELKQFALAMAERLDRAAENKINRRVHARRLNKELRNGAPAR
jgi:hypothetical protein